MFMTMDKRILKQREGAETIWITVAEKTTRKPPHLRSAKDDCEIFGSEPLGSRLADALASGCEWSDER